MEDLKTDMKKLLEGITEYRDDKTPENDREEENKE